ncbi:T9SS C-terminal target domain-containing protein [Aquimarina sp. BL5]|uniref:T9SS type A sorting domain-containing protein n=1 Tax=Aquimarina sp. BL5 TaxID=1714860 RepID=UPI000E4DC631|nr:T9SS type A sorting domain-containing protein [Aquimarina sp. BL5]AXT49887.1 T9SS C-terminal target domain-containing protein [Aquimarina sp. BL5]RKN01810.1 T9SS C-terminal target domain-containing protein [Aquimarina sp. BL5]
MKRIVLIVIVFCSAQISFGQATIKTMFYNVLNYPSAPPTNREEILETIIDSYEPDIFMICELETEDGGDEILNDSLNDDGNNYSSAPFLSNFSNSDVELHQLLYYNNQKFTLIQSQRLTTTIRDINWYTLELISDDQSNNPIRIEVFVAHLKASRGADNETKRLNMVREFTDNYANLDENDYVIFAGDFNLYSSEEPAYQELLDANNKIVMVDPITTPGDWSSNITFTDIHTQSTRISSDEFGDFGSGGGLDDRFDFILMSENMINSPELSYKPDTYSAYGNNGNCYNQRIDNADCTGKFDSALRDALYNMSDHLPVVMELQVNQQLLSTTEFVETPKTIQLNSGTIIDDILSLQINNHPEPIDFRIYNTLGQEIVSFSANGNSITNIPVSALSKGMYYLVPVSMNSNTIKFLKKN